VRRAVCRKSASSLQFALQNLSWLFHVGPGAGHASRKLAKSKNERPHQ